VHKEFWEITVRDMIWFAVILATIVWSIAVMPQQIGADLTSRFASRERVDMICDRLDRIEGKVDLIVTRVR
jgi:hypothetical protein